MFSEWKNKYKKTMSGDPLNILVFMGSVREMRMADRVCKFVCAELTRRGHKVTIFDPLEKKLDLLSTPFHFYKDPAQAPTQLREMDSDIRAADAFITLTAEYNRSVPPALTNMLDHFSPRSYAYRPCAIVSYSAAVTAGCAASISLRTLLSELRCLVTPAVTAIGEVYKTLDELGQTDNKMLLMTLEVSLDQLEYVAKAMKAAKANQGEPP